MQFIRLFSCLMALIFSCSTFANESTSFLMGQIEGEEGLETAFILQLHGDDLENRVKITEDGEVYIKVDRIVSVSQNKLSTVDGQYIQYDQQRNSFPFQLCKFEPTIAGYDADWRCRNLRCMRMNKAVRKVCVYCDTPRHY